MEIEKANKRRKGKMGAAPAIEFSGRDLIQSLMQTLGYKSLQQLASLLGISERTLRNWAEISYEELDKKSLCLKVLFHVVERMKEENIPQSAILKLISGQLLDRSGAPTLINKINLEPKNDLIEVTAEGLIKDFKKGFYSKISKQELDEVNNRFRLTDDQQHELLKKFKK